MTTTQVKIDIKIIETMSVTKASERIMKNLNALLERRKLIVANAVQLQTIAKQF